MYIWYAKKPVSWTQSPVSYRPQRARERAIATSTLRTHSSYLCLYFATHKIQSAQPRHIDGNIASRSVVPVQWSCACVNVQSFVQYRLLGSTLWLWHRQHTHIAYTPTTVTLYTRASQCYTESGQRVKSLARIPESVSRLNHIVQTPINRSKVTQNRVRNIVHFAGHKVLQTNTHWNRYALIGFWTTKSIRNQVARLFIFLFSVLDQFVCCSAPFLCFVRRCLFDIT